jgi:hypothetical protein
LPGILSTAFLLEIFIVLVRFIVDSKLNENLGDPVSETAELVGFRRRFVAYLIDDLIVSVIQLAILIPASSSVIAAAAKGGEDTLTKFSPFLNFLFLLIIYKKHQTWALN